MVTCCFQNTVYAIVDEIGGFEARRDQAVSFILGQFRRMPVFLAWPLRMATVAFSFTAIFTSGTLFHRLDSGRRRVQMERWQASHLGPCRNLMTFYSSLALLALYSRPAK